MIRCDRLRVDRGGVAVVDGVSLDVPAGRGLALIGRSGAGKSSLLAAAATAIPIHSGDVVVAGQSARRAAAAVRRLIGSVPDRMPDAVRSGFRQSIGHMVMTATPQRECRDDGGRQFQRRPGSLRHCRLGFAEPKKMGWSPRGSSPLTQVVPVKRVELPTFALRMRCSTN